MAQLTTREGRTPLTAAQRQLASSYIPLAKNLAWPYRVNWPSAKEEFESAALMALVEAAEAFNPTRSVRFSTFAKHRIRGALLDVQRRMILWGWRKRKDIPDELPAWEPLPSCPEESGRILGCEPEGPVGADIEMFDEVENWLRKLPPRNAAACREIYVHGHTFTETARRLGYSQTRVSFLHSQAMAMLNGTWEQDLQAAETSYHEESA